MCIYVCVYARCVYRYTINTRANAVTARNACIIRLYAPCHMRTRCTFPCTTATAFTCACVIIYLAVFSTRRKSNLFTRQSSNSDSNYYNGGCSQIFTNALAFYIYFFFTVRYNITRVIRAFFHSIYIPERLRVGNKFQSPGRHVSRRFV